MVVGEVAVRTEVLVIGGGPGGYTAAAEAARLGRAVMLVEREQLGGVCLNVGCIPSKALLHVADVVDSARQGASLGIDANVTVDMRRVRSHLLDVINPLRDGVDRLLSSAGVTVATGTARFTTPNRVVVEHDGSADHIEFEQAIVATGSLPVALPELPFDPPYVVDSTGALALEDLPELAVIVGGGYIGVELATALAKLGTSVTIIERAPNVLPGMDPAIGALVARSLVARGVQVLTGVDGVDRNGTKIVVSRGEQVDVIPADVVIVAVGRRPATADLGLDRTGATCATSGHLVVDAGRRASATVLGIGDVTPGPALAHKAIAEAVVAAATAAGQRAAFDPRAIPTVVYSDPEVASVGLTRAAAEDDGITVVVGTARLTTSGRAMALGATDGFCQLVCARDDGTVVGAHLVGPQVSEIVSEIALAIEMGAAAADLALTVHPHPSIAEAVAEAASTVTQRLRRHTE